MSAVGEMVRRIVTLTRKSVSRVLMSPLSPLYLIPTFRKAVKLLKVNQEIAQLEASSNFDRARSVRDRALEMVDPRCSTPLWRSRGFDLLRLGQVREALAAFETGIHHLYECGFLYGVAPPDELYYGAALAAFRAGDVERARQYYRKTTEVITAMRQEFQMERKPAWWDAGLALLRRQLEGSALSQDCPQPNDR